ncbi:MAG: ATP-binding protein [Myxococcota bacterium]
MPLYFACCLAGAVVLRSEAFAFGTILVLVYGTLLRRGWLASAAVTELITGHVTLLTLVFDAPLSTAQGFLYFLPVYVGTRFAAIAMVPYLALMAALTVDLLDGVPAWVDRTPQVPVSPFDALMAVIVLVAAGGTAVLFRGRERRALERMVQALAEQAREVEVRREAEAKALASSRAKSEFLAMMSHEVRTPLNGILGAAQLLDDADLLPAKREHVQVIEASGRSLLVVLSDILDFSRFESGEVDLDPVPVELRALVRQLERIHRPAAEAKGLAFTVNVDASLPGWFLADPVRLLQVCGNLLSNAVKFTESGTVKVSFEGAGGRLRMAVDDTGIGISPDALGRVFEPFEQGDRSTARRFGGTGLGLSIARRLVQAMDGVLEVASAPGRGSRFHFSVPLEACSPLTLAEEPQVSAGAAALPLKVLVVDDDAVNRTIAAKLLAREGIEVQTVDGGEAALARVEADADIDLVLMDVRMPGMDGREATRRLRARFADRALAIVGLSAEARPEEREASLAAGMDAFITKPFRTEKVLSAWSAWCEAEGRLPGEDVALSA